MEQSTSKNPGKSLCAAGLVISIIALLGTPFVFFISIGWASFEGGLLDAIILGSAWLVLSIASFLLALNGRKKMRSSGRSGATGMTGMIFGVLNILLSIGILVASYSSSI